MQYETTFYIHCVKTYLQVNLKTLEVDVIDSIILIN